MGRCGNGVGGISSGMTLSSKGEFICAPVRPGQTKEALLAATAMAASTRYVRRVCGFMQAAPKTCVPTTIERVEGAGTDQCL